MATPKRVVVAADVESQWYQALFEEDCIAVMQLLDTYPSLLKVGWESEPSRQVEGRMRREGAGRTHSIWKGRTALHVAASRGCVKLIMKVLRRCNLDGFPDVNTAYEKTLLPTVLDQISAVPHPNMEGKGPSAVAEEKDPSAVAVEKDPAAVAAQKVPPVVAEKKDPVTAGPSLEPSNRREASVETSLGDTEIAESEAPWRGDSPVDRTTPQSDPLKDEEREKETRTGDLASKGPPGKLQETISAIMARLAEEKKKANARQSAARIERQRLKKESNQDAISRDYVSEIDRRRLLLAKDGEIGLDALAIAVLHGKEEVIYLLRYCIGNKVEIQTHYYKISIDASEAISMFDEIATRNIEKRKLLRKITVAAAMIYIEKGKEEEDAAESVDSDNGDAAEAVDTDNEDTNSEGSTASENTDEENDDEQIAIDRTAFDEYLKGHDASTPFSLDEVIDNEVFKAYFEHRDFNFLPPEEYLFHFLCSGDPLYSTAVQQPDESWVEFGLMNTLWMAARSWSGDDNLWRFLLQELTDGQGRPPFHIAMEDSNDYYIISILFQSDTTEGKKVIVVAMTAPDEAGRTPVQKVAAAGRYGELENLIELASKYECDEVAATYHESWTGNTEDWGSSWAHGFPLMFPLPQTPLHAALVNKNFSCAELLLNEWFKRKRPHMTYRSSDEVMYSPGNPAPWSQRARNITNVKTWMQQEICGVEAVTEWIEWDLLELSIVVGAPLTFIEKLTKRQPDEIPAVDKADIITSKTQLHQQAGDLATPSLYVKRDEKRGGDTTVVVEHKWHPLHLAASFGNYDLVKYFIGDLKWDPFVEDSEGNSVLHYATKGREFELPTHLLDYVSVEHYSISQHNRTSTAEETILQIAERQGCINFLLQTGCDVFKTNNDNQVPYPTGSLKDDKFLSWWYAKQEKEFTAAQSNLNFATNAIAVTATLVATASYVGPLQPPLGYDSNHIQYTNGWVSTFIVCDTLSFYLAIVAITLSLIPSLPMPQQAMMEELHRTREMVIMAVSILLPSIFFVFVAFACSSISVMSDNITSQGGGILVIIFTLLGAVLCLLAFILFFIRLLAFIFPKNKPIRYLYDQTFVTRYFKDFSKASSWFHEKKKKCKVLSKERRSIPTAQKQERPAGVLQDGTTKL